MLFRSAKHRPPPTLCVPPDPPTLTPTPSLLPFSRSLPNLKIDIVAGDIARATYALSPYVSRTTAFELDGGESPDHFADLQGSVLGNYYDLLVSAVPASYADASAYYALGIPRRVAYIGQQASERERGRREGGGARGGSTRLLVACGGEAAPSFGGDGTRTLPLLSHFPFSRLTSGQGFVTDSLAPSLLTTAVAAPAPSGLTATLGASMCALPPSLPTRIYPLPSPLFSSPAVARLSHTHATNDTHE